MSDYCATPEERHEVAERLRENSTFHNAEEALRIICKCTIRTMKGSKGVMEVLADLLDPTCHMIDSEWDNGECTWGCICKECGSRFEHERVAYINYCPTCGSRVVSEDA